MNKTSDKPTIRSTALARMLAGQKRGFTANIRHLLKTTMLRASCTKFRLTKMNTNAGSTNTRAECNRCEKPLVGLSLRIVSLIATYNDNKVGTVCRYASVHQIAGGFLMV